MLTNSQDPETRPEFYSIDSTRISHREYCWGTRSPLVILLGWSLKWLRVRLPSSTDDPNVASIAPFRVEQLPESEHQHFLVHESYLLALGYLDPVYHLFQDPGTSTTIYWATYRHASGKSFARIHHRIWKRAKKQDRGTFIFLFTAFADGTFAGASTGKPDMKTPATVPMLWREGEAVPALYQAHQEQVAGMNKPVKPVLTQEELLGAIESHHALLRDFNLARGVFRAQTETERASAEAVSERLKQATEGGFQNPEILAEVHRLQTQRPGWGNALLILVISIAAFLAAGRTQQNWKFYLWIIPVLFLHESGHWVAMKIFGYRNLRMFFIPLFGAAVTGRNWNVAGWKKALVSLAGPVPGILLGVALTPVGVITHRPWVTEAAVLLLLLNGFNLLPVLPLDGGHALHSILFCRNRWMDIAFRVAAIVGLLAMSAGGFGRFFMYLAIMMAVGLPTAYKTAKVADSFRRNPLPPPMDGQEEFPLANADAIASALKAEFQGQATTQVLAQRTLSVFETLNARPPGTLGTLGLLSLHGLSVLLVLAFGMLLILDKHGGGLGNFARAAIRQPRHHVAATAIQRWSGSEAAGNSQRNLLVATLTNNSTAKKQFADLSGHLPANSSLMLFGDTLFLSLPASDDDGRERWFGELHQAAPDTFVALSNQSVTASVMAIARDEKEAKALVDELNEYFQERHFGDLVAPWSPQAAGADYRKARQARQTWNSIESSLNEVYTNPASRDISRQISAALKRGARSETEQLRQKLKEEREKQVAAVYERLQSQGIDPALIELHRKYSQAQTRLSDPKERAAINREIALKLGLASGTASPQGTGIASGPRYGATSGFVRNTGLLVELNWMGFADAPTALPALIDWLTRNHCQSLKYDILPSPRGDFLADKAEDDEND